MVSAAKQKLIVALDFDRLEPALALVRELRGLAGWFKIGKQLFTAEGPRAVEGVASVGASIFLDLKFHDIPNTVAQALRAAAGLPGVKLVNVHAAGGGAMLRAAVDALRGLPEPPALLAVTVLTSMDARALREVGMAGPPAKQVLRLARLVQRCNLDGVVASPQEIRSIRRACGAKFLIVTPGVRPAGSARGDQRRTATPAQALRAGADYLVVGRPVTAAQDPAAAAARIAAEMDAALR